MESAKAISQLPNAGGQAISTGGQLFALSLIHI